ncbi:hypothetical protein BHM03_00025430 [Ensete ventricosum]|uniref:Uncharacterized protein n=1 Tax=Ensete ventricosum TaxID=4639 RepID=A0A445MGZ5_ENSVE|nr:hypothetical protein BHM03_00025430 [Ensete ventricosum]
MAAKRSESEGSSDDGGRRGQQRRWLRLRCDFVAASGVSCSKGAAAIGGRWAAVCTAVAEEGSSGLEREMAAVVFNLLLAAIKIVDSERLIAAGCDHGGWQRVVAVGSIVQRKMRAAVEGIREIGWLKGWWTKGCDFWVRFVAVLGAIWGCGVVEFRLRIGIYDVDAEDDSRLMDLRLGGRQWMIATSKAIVGIALKMKAVEMAIGQQKCSSDTR